MPFKVLLKKNEEKRIVAGHSWIYANEVQSIEGKDKNGSIAEVYSFDGRFIGKGFINHLSKIIVRILTRKNEDIDKTFFYNKIKEAVDYRINLGYDNCYRAVFAEADGLPALIVDKYGDVLSIQLLSLGMDLNKDIILQCLIEIFNPIAIYERSDVSVRLKEGLAEFKGLLYGKLDGGRTEIIENGLKISVDIGNGQKTGYFLDQKENRFAVRRYVKGKNVLDCFCNSGGFSLNAAAAGAASVIAADISQEALSDVETNAGLNGFQNIIKTQCGDVFALLRDYRKEGRKFDVIILDPPAFCKTADEIKDAYRGYKDINLSAIRIIEKGGFLVTSSCSHYMNIQMFFSMLADAAKDSGRVVKSVEMRTQSADHPSLLAAEETQYIKFFVLSIL